MVSLLLEAGADTERLSRDRNLVIGRVLLGDSVRLRVSDFGFRVQGFAFGVWDSGFRVQDLGLGVRI